MIKNYIVLSIIFIGVLYSCHSYKETKHHIHHGHSHSHVLENINQDYFGNYNLEDKNFGTKTKVTLKDNKRILVTNALPNHKTGEFPRKGNPNTISAQNRTYELPLEPKWVGKPQWVREIGVALNGVKFEPGTAEVVVCNTGENYRVEAFQNIINLGLDFNNAHVQPNGAYHYHGTPTSVISNHESKEDIIHIGFANDGYPIYYSKKGVYKSSYKAKDGDREGEGCVYTNPKKTINIDVVDDHDGTFTSDFEFVKNSGDLDECNGIEIDGEYMYFVTDEFPYISRCLMGEVVLEKPKRGPRGDEREPRNINIMQRDHSKERPSASQIIEHMDTNSDGKLSESELKGPLKQMFSKIDTDRDGYITKQELENGHKSQNR